MNIAIHGERELLVRIRAEAVWQGADEDKQWNDEYVNLYPQDIRYISIGHRILFMYNKPFFAQKFYHLTPSNYNEILKIIIERKDEKEERPNR